jgi:hypothetical protein
MRWEKWRQPYRACRGRRVCRVRKAMPQPGGYAASAKLCRKLQDHAVSGKTMEHREKPCRRMKPISQAGAHWQAEADLAG